MTLQIHPQARTDLNGRAEALLTKLVPFEPGHRLPKSRFVPDIPVAATFTEESILDIESSLVDGRGIEVARFFYDPHPLGFSEESFSDFKALASSTYSHPCISGIASARTVADVLFRWCRDRTSHVITLPFFEYLEVRLQEMVADHEVWLPVSTLYIEEPFPLGCVLLQPITSEHIDRLTAHWHEAEGTPEDKTSAVLKLRDQIQGLAAATSTYRAELARAEELAAEASEAALSMLRLFSSEILHPYGWSLCSVDGLSASEGNLRFVLKEGVPVSMLQSLPDGLREWRISSEQLDRLLSTGLGAACDLLQEKSRTDLEEVLLRALRHYSISALKKDPSEKLLYIVTALESLLLGGKEEGQIAQNFRDRFAILRGRDLASRLKAQKRAGLIYGIRSRFVHGGFPAQDLPLLEEFMMDAWIVFTSLLRNRRFAETRDLFIKSIDAHRMAGPPFGSIRIS